MTASDIEARYGPVVGRFNSKSEPDKIYEVRQRDGHRSCNCPGWRFRRRCKHTDYIDSHGSFLSSLGVAMGVPTAEPKQKAKAKPRPQDAVVVIVEKMLNAADIRPMLGDLKKMANVLRPYLKRPLGSKAENGSQESMQAEVESSAPRLIRMITLDD